MPEGYVDDDEADGLPEDQHDWEEGGGSEEDDE
jgi:hypothetical protein